MPQVLKISSTSPVAAEDENSAVGWIDIDKLEESVSEPPMLPIYKKLLKRANDC